MATFSKGLGAIISLALMFTTPAWADTCSGLDTLVTQDFETIDLGHGLKKSVWTATSVVTSTDSIYKLLVGECTATMLQTEDGNTQSSGFCARHDKDGDTASIAIHQPPGADKNEWRVTGGTGKYANNKDTGWAQPAYADGSVLVVKWGGDCKKAP